MVAAGLLGIRMRARVFIDLQLLREVALVRDRRRVSGLRIRGGGRLLVVERARGALDAPQRTSAREMDECVGFVACTRAMKMHYSWRQRGQRVEAVDDDEPVRLAVSVLSQKPYRPSDSISRCTKFQSSSSCMQNERIGTGW